MCKAMMNRQADGRGATRKRGGRWIGHTGVSAVMLAGLAAGAPDAQAQEVTELLTTELPYPQYRTVQRDHYSLRIGPVRVRYDLSVTAVYTDNRNYAPSGEKEEDWGLRPVFHLGMFYAMSDRQKLQIDVGIGYEWWDRRDENNDLYIAPSSHIDYTFGIGPVQMRLSNTTSTSTEASSRAEVAGGDAFAFNRLNNSTTLGATYIGSRRLILNGAYTYGISRSLNDYFESLDRDTHSVGGSALFRITAPLAAGISANYSVFTYSDEVQNDGQSYSVGPMVMWSPTRSIDLEAFVHYTRSTFDDNGTIEDDDDFSGATFSVSGVYRMNRYVTHRLTFGKVVDPGYGSNYTEDFSLRYGAQARLSSRLSSNLNFHYQSASLSGSGPLSEEADLYQFSVGAGYQVLRRANLGLTYSLNTRDSDRSNRSYVENRVMVTASYQF